MVTGSFFFHAVAHSAHGDNQPADVAQFTAQRPHMDINVALGHEHIGAYDGIEQLVA